MLSTLILAALLTGAHPQSLLLDHSPESTKLRGELPAVLAAAGADERLPITIVLADQVPREALGPALQALPKPERRAHVRDLLQQHARRTQAALLARLEAAQDAGLAGPLLRPLWIHGVVGAEVTPALALELAAREDVAYVSHDRPAPREVLAAAPGGVLECGVEVLRADRVWSELGIDGHGVVVAVIDTGCCVSHPDIQERVWHNVCEVAGNGVDDDGNGYVDDVVGWDFTAGDGDVDDDLGHGSHVAGTVAGDGTSGNQSGTAPGAEVMVLAFDAFNLTESAVWEAMQYALANGADVVNGSLGWHHDWGPDRATWRVVCENTIAAGLVAVFAAQNFYCGDAPDNVSTPGDVPDVITVGATDCADVKAGFSSCGPVTWQDVPAFGDWPYPPGLVKPTVAAPGVFTLSHDDCSGYSELSGTSMATPHVSGAVALLLQADPTLDQYGVAQLLTSTAVDLGAPGNDNEFGHGRVDAYEAVRAALTSGNFCEAKTNSCGGLPAISSSGVPSASSGSGFVVTGSNARGGGTAGILAYTDQGRRFPPLPFDGGQLCVSAPIRRTVVVTSGGTPGACDGAYAIDMNAFAAGALGGSPQPWLSAPGTTVTCQWWGRDTAAHGVYLTAALEYTICP